MYYARRFGKFLLFFVLALWLGAWFIVAGGIEKTRDWTARKTLEVSADLGFEVHDILVEGRNNTSPDVLKALINMEKGDPIFAFDPEGAREMIERISWVKSARVERRLPDTIYVGLNERVPLALWRNETGKLVLVDNDGKILADKNLQPFEAMIIVEGQDAPEHTRTLFDFLDAEIALKDLTKSAKRISNRRWNLHLKNGIEVYLPETDIGLALRRLMAAHEEGSIFDKDIIHIDLRKEDRIIVRPRRGSAHEWSSGSGRKI